MLDWDGHKNEEKLRTTTREEKEGPHFEGREGRNKKVKSRECSVGNMIQGRGKKKPAAAFLALAALLAAAGVRNSEASALGGASDRESREAFVFPQNGQQPRDAESGEFSCKKFLFSSTRDVVY